MKILIKSTTLSLLILLLKPTFTQAQCHIVDWTALKALYDSTNGDNWTNRTGWDVMIDDLINPPANCDLSALFGITTNNGRVNCIDMDGQDNCIYSEMEEGNNLDGTIPPELGNLSNLSSLHLSYNNLIGNLPPELQNLSELRSLFLINNGLTGEIPPEIGNLTNLRYVRLTNNSFSGNIPEEIGNLNKLIQLFLTGNNLEGTIPSTIGNLTALEYLNIGGNPLSGSVPTSIGNLDLLLGLDVSSSQISAIPSEIENINNLLSLSIGHSQLTSIPLQIGNLSSLRDLYMNNIQLLPDNIPSQIWNLTNLKVLQIQNNNFTGYIPTEIGNLTNLEYLNVRGNDLTGTIPISLNNLTKLKNLTLSGNNFSGNIFNLIVNFPDLENFQASRNQFTGNIPSSINSLTQLREMSLLYNNFSGTLPTELGELDQLTSIILGENQFDGCYPNSINIFCSHDSHNTNSYMSQENNFQASWEDFCATGAGTCFLSDVYPGDLNHDGIVNHVDLGLSGLYKTEIGSSRTSEHQNTNWYAHPADDWGTQQLNNEDIKHFDCNGDGFIDEGDHQAVLDNMGEIWTIQSPQTPAPMPPPQSDYQVMLHPIDQISEDYLMMNIALERRAGRDLTLQGGHFTIDYSEIEGNIDFVTLGFKNESWLGDRDIDLSYVITELPSQQKIDVGFTKSNNLNSEGNGIIGQLILSFDNGATHFFKTSNNLYEFQVNTVGVHNGTTFTPIEDQLLQVDASNGICQPNWTITEDTPFRNEYKSDGIIATNGFVLIGAGQEVEYQANGVDLNIGFEVKVGASFRAYVSCD